MTKRCENEVLRGVLAEREACAKLMCVLCRHGIPLHGDFHIIDKLVDAPKEGELIPVERVINPPVAMACHAKPIRDRSQSAAPGKGEKNG